MLEFTATSEESVCDLGPANFVIGIPIPDLKRIDARDWSQVKNVSSS